MGKCFVREVEVGGLISSPTEAKVGLESPHFALDDIASHFAIRCIELASRFLLDCFTRLCTVVPHRKAAQSEDGVAGLWYVWAEWCGVVVYIFLDGLAACVHYCS